MKEKLRDQWFTKNYRHVPDFTIRAGVLPTINLLCGAALRYADKNIYIRFNFSLKDTEHWLLLMTEDDIKISISIKEDSHRHQTMKTWTGIVKCQIIKTGPRRR